ncbi:hypothetical protein DAPPUDRAFT_234172 [Daphnia pulex]|uniref:Uncharacterized protein n=1 Tax=Daphnia pulex TaxID=6669 RepID=E9FUR8_DAPPU|nr:hypothetical protein DAPPUDRAFT_234172 [Daphnia pulex]|eukprot:EFX88776.1 hypothetical protein DAPPUDRAFT_234172 [Daphnia pulex]
MIKNQEKVRDGDPFAQLLQKLRTQLSLSFMAVISLMWFCCSQPEFVINLMSELFMFNRFCRSIGLIHW